MYYRWRTNATTAPAVTFAAVSRILLSVDELDFAALYERHARDVYRFSLYLSGNCALAVDLSLDAVNVRVHRARVRLTAVRAGMEITHVHHTTRDR